MVHHALEAVALLRRRGGHLVPALACCGALLAGCGDSGGTAEAPRAAAVASVGTVRQADCTDWQRGSAGQRRMTVTYLRRFAGGPVVFRSGVRSGLVLEDARAYRILDRYCAQYFARGFKLYKLYGRAATLIGNRPKPAPDL